jgi:hypothetical protein
MKRRTDHLTLAIEITVGLHLAGIAWGQTAFYVAPGGSDANPGTRARPFANLETARDAIRRLKEQEAWPRGGVTVWLRQGDYTRTRSFELASVDSGRPDAPMVYCAYRNETVRLLGGQMLNGFQPITDPAVVNRLSPQARGQVVQMDLRAGGITDYGQLRSRGFGRSLQPAHAELFFDGKPMVLARWPNQGQWEKIAGFPASASQGDDHGGKTGQLAAGFHYAGDRPRGWQESNDIWVHGYWSWDWANSYERVQSIDPQQRLIVTAPPRGLYGFRKDQRYYYLNVLEELDQPGEYYLDRSRGMLYFWPPRPAAATEILLAMLEGPLVKMTDASHVVFRGLTLAATRGHAVVIQGGTSNLIAACGIRLIGNYGVQVDGGRGHGVLACDVEDTGDGGVSISGGDRQTLSPGGHWVENCWFQRQGRWSKCYVPAVLVSGVGHRVVRNLIQDHPHCAILFSGNDHRIEGNEIHHVALETGDVGAIYAGRDWTYRGNVIRHNFIHHTGGVGMGSMGVYMDDCVSGTEIVGNIFYQVSRAAFLGGGRDHHVENNVFVDCHPAVQIDGRGLDKSPVWHNMVYDFMKRQMTRVPQALYRQRYPRIADLDRYYATTNGVPPEGNLVSRNICAGGEWLQIGWHARTNMIDVRDNWVGANPGFVDAGIMDFRLRKTSPAWGIGFQAIPVKDIGLKSDAWRRELDRRHR